MHSSHGSFAKDLYLCIVFMVLDLRLIEDWLSGDNQFFFAAYPKSAKVISPPSLLIEPSLIHSSYDS